MFRTVRDMRFATIASLNCVMQRSLRMPVYAPTRVTRQMVSVFARPSLVVSSGRLCAQCRGARPRQLARCKEPGREEPAPVWAGISQQIIDESEKPAFLIVQGFLGLAFLALIDGGLSGTTLRSTCCAIHAFTRALFAVKAYILHSLLSGVYPGILPVSYTHLTLPTICSV